MKPLFQDNSVDFSEEFKDRVKAIHEHFDIDADGYLNFEELAALQKVTEGVRLTEENYIMACRALECSPAKGISVQALKLTYASDGTNIGK